MRLNHLDLLAHDVQALASFFVDHFDLTRLSNDRSPAICVLTDDAGFTLIYDMELKMPLGPFFKTEIASVCFTRDGKISELRDYYDFPSSLVSPFGPLRRLYGGIIRALFL